MPADAAVIAAAVLRIHLERRSSDPLPREAFPRAGDHPFMLDKEWTHDASWEMPPEDIASFGQLAESLQGLALRVADDVLGDDRALAELGLAPVAGLLRRSRERGEETLVTRMDFALEPAGPGQFWPRLLELNGDTAGNLFEGGLTQREWGAAVGLPTAGDRMEEAVAEALRGLPGPLVVLHHPGDPYIACTARYLASLVPGATRVEYPDVPGDPVASVYKMFRWGRLWDGRFPEVGAWAAERERGISEPPWGVLLQHKGLLAWMWDAAPTTPGLLPTTLAGPAALPNGGAKGWAEKSFHGVSGYEVTLHPPGTAPGPARAGHVWQTLVPPARVDGLYPILCAVLVRGRFAGALMREDDTVISTDDIVAPIGLVPRGAVREAEGGPG